MHEDPIQGDDLMISKHESKCTMESTKFSTSMHQCTPVYCGVHTVLEYLLPIIPEGTASIGNDRESEWRGFVYKALKSTIQTHH